MDPTTDQITCRPGDEVLSSDEHKLGKVVAVDTQFVTVEHGFLSKSRYFVPTRAVNTCAPGKVYLNVRKDEVERSHWDVPPAVETDAGSATISH